MNKKSLVKRLMPYVMVYKWRILFSVLILILGKAIAVADPYILKLIIDALVENKEALIPTLIVLIALYFLLQSGAEFMEGIRTWIFAPAETNIKRLVALDIFKYLINLPVSFHTDRSTGGISRKVTRGANGLETMLFFVTGNIVPTLIQLIFITVVFISLFPWTFTAVLLGFVISFVAYTMWAVEKRQEILLTANKYDDEASGKSIDALLNYETVKYFTNENYEHERYGSFLSRWVTSDIASSKMEAYIYRGQGIIIAIGLTALLSLAVREYLQGGMTIGDMILVTTYLGQISIPLSFLGFIYRRLKESIADMDEMFKLLDVPNTIKDKDDAKVLTDIKGEIRFDDVSFAYSNEREVLSHISFSVPEKKRVALVGYSGSGKSTISKLLLRLYDVRSGSIKIDGIDIRDVTQESLRGVIGVVAQDTALFNDTIFENIRYGKPNATKEEIEQVAKVAHIHEFIVNDLPQGYETVVGERGVKLSGGEKQRVAIARMLLKNPRILLFDEATASLDSKAEKVIQTAISELSKEGRTTVVIAHRLSTIVDFDEIIVLERGSIVERGSHGELLQKNGVYARLWAIQNNGEGSE
ncbi:MAG: ABC transporter ATP-binding protein/permease [Candidatus Paceibacterota bacterium]